MRNGRARCQVRGGQSRALPSVRVRASIGGGRDWGRRIGGGGLSGGVGTHCNSWMEGTPKEGGGLLKWEDFGDPRGFFFFPTDYPGTSACSQGQEDTPSPAQRLCS